MQEQSSSCISILRAELAKDSGSLANMEEDAGEVFLIPIL